MTRVIKYQDGKLENGAFGYPRGQKRRRKPTAIACLHISGNKRTAKMPAGIGPGSGTRAEVAYMALPGSPGGNSAHSYIARNGDMLDCIPWRDYAAWNNGALLRPNLKVAGVRVIKVQNDRVPGYNPNEAFWWEVEGTGYPGSFPLTPEQRETMARRIARISIEKRMPINRNTVLMHSDLDGVNRRNCPFSAGSAEKQLAALIKRANEVKRSILSPVPPPPDPEPEPDPDPVPDELEALRQQLVVMEDRVEELQSDNARMASALAAVIVDAKAGLVEDAP